MMPIRDVAHYLAVGEGMGRDIDKSYLQKTFSKPRLRDLEVIAIVEITQQMMRKGIPKSQTCKGCKTYFVTSNQ